MKKLLINSNYNMYEKQLIKLCYIMHAKNMNRIKY